MTKLTIEQALEDHKAWTEDNEQGKRFTTTTLDRVRGELGAAGLRGEYLIYADLRNADFAGIDLTGAQLGGADLRSSNLKTTAVRAHFGSAKLQGATMQRIAARDAVFTDAGMKFVDLRGADLRSARMFEADLSRARLDGANLTGAGLKGANLRCASFHDAKIRGAELPSPTMVLLARWGDLNPALCAKAMRFDAANHLNGVTEFSAWADGCPCPYANTRYERACNFVERYQHWDPSLPVPTAMQLMIDLIREQCADSDYHDKA